jgi:hypothetical protein
VGGGIGKGRKVREGDPFREGVAGFEFGHGGGGGEGGVRRV